LSAWNGSMGRKERIGDIAGFLDEQERIGDIAGFLDEQPAVAQRGKLGGAGRRLRRGSDLPVTQNSGSREKHEKNRTSAQKAAELMKVCGAPDQLVTGPSPDQFILVWSDDPCPEVPKWHKPLLLPVLGQENGLFVRDRESSQEGVTGPIIWSWSDDPPGP
jgi:hypothetical protein